MITPLINIRIVTTSENETEIPEVREFAKTIESNILSVKAVSLYYDRPGELHPPGKQRY